jgi:hypothetical protein
MMLQTAADVLQQLCPSVTPCADSCYRNVINEVYNVLMYD